MLNPSSRWSSWLWTIGKVVFLLAAAAGLLYWFRFQPVAVEEQVVARGLAVNEVLGTGTLEAQIMTTISPKVSGRIEQIHVDQGDFVEAGQLLIQLDDAELVQQSEIARAEVEARRAGLERLAADRTRATAVQRQAQSNYDRLSSLIQNNAVSRDELDKSTEALALAEADVARTDAANLEGLKLLAVAERTLEYQQTRLADSRITAPFAGLIVRRQRDPGDIVVPGSSIMTLISTEVLWVSAWVDETELDSLKVGQPARIVFRSTPETALPGQVARLGRETDRETRELIVDVQIQQLPENWTLGQRAEVYIETHRRENAVVIPHRFLSRRENELGVFVNREGAVAWQPVRTGLLGPEVTEILEGLEPGDRIITAQSGTPLRPGQRIAQP